MTHSHLGRELHVLTLDQFDKLNFKVEKTNSGYVS